MDDVIGSSGSVVPLFKEQIARGGPLTFTHNGMTRYFMSVREAVELIIQASALSESGAIPCFWRWASRSASANWPRR